MDISIININDFDIKLLTFSKSFFIGQNKKKISIGYDDNTDFHILTPLFTNSMDFLSNHKYQYLKMVFDPMLGNILKFYNIIKSIENSVKELILKHNKNYTMQSIIRNDQMDMFIDDEEIDIELNSIKNIYLKLSNHPKLVPLYKIYDSNNNECQLNNLKNGWKYKALIKIDSIWIDTMKKKFGINLDLIQLKILQPIVQTKCLIDNDVIIVKKDIYRYSNNTLAFDQDIRANISMDPFVNNMSRNVSVFANSDNLTNSDNSTNSANTTTNTTNTTTNSDNSTKRISFIAPNAMDLLKMKNALKKVLE
jgi:hypothetical protein